MREALSSRRRIAMPSALVAIVSAALALTGCGTDDIAKGGGDDGRLSADLAIGTAPYLVLDLEHARVEGRQAPPSVSGDAFDRLLILRALPSGTADLGSQPGALGAQSDEAMHAGRVGRIFIGMCELTQAQWQRLAGTAPWASVPSAIVGGSQAIGFDRPAFAISHAEATRVLSMFPIIGGLRLRLPSDEEWEYACRAGSAGAYAWGERSDGSFVATQAVVWETASSAPAPHAVGGLAANAFGLFDMHGNVWELTSEGHVRGGSWNDPLLQARAANLATLRPDTPHPTVGLRVVLGP